MKSQVSNGKKVEVFKTNIRSLRDARRISKGIADSFHPCKVNFDLDDCDKILRIEGSGIKPSTVENFIKKLGFECKVLV